MSSLTLPLAKNWKCMICLGLCSSGASAIIHSKVWYVHWENESQITKQPEDRRSKPVLVLFWP